MNTKYPLLLAVVLVLAGCATPNDMRQTKPTQSFESRKPARVVGVCIADTWDKDPSIAQASRGRETNSGYTVSAYCEGMYPCMVADVATTSGGSKTVTHTRGIGSDAFMRAAQKCQ